MQTAKDVMQGFIDHVWNKRELDRFGEFVAPEIRFHPPRGPPKSFEEYRAMARDFQAAFSDLHFAVEKTLVDGDHVAMQLIITGTNDGPFRKWPASGKQVRVVGRPWARVRGGMIVEFWQLFDELGMIEQLGH